MADRKVIPTFRHDAGIWTSSTGRRVEVVVTVKPSLANALVRRAMKKDHGRASMCGGAFSVQLKDAPPVTPPTPKGSQ
jgi:hypothetical protein